MILKAYWFQLVEQTGHRFRKLRDFACIVHVLKQSRNENDFLSRFHFGTNKNSEVRRGGKRMQIYHAQHPGIIFPAYKQHRTAQFRNNRNQAGNPIFPTHFSRIAWAKGAAYKAIQRMKLQKSGSECNGCCL